MSLGLNMASRDRLSVQLYLVRHGETEANRDNILVRPANYPYELKFHLGSDEQLCDISTARTL